MAMVSPAAGDQDDRFEDEVEDEVEDEGDDLDELDVLDEDAGEETGNVVSGQANELASFVQYMVNNLVDDPSTFQVVPQQYGSNVHIKVLVPEEEMGKVIGRQGRIARSMRTLLTIAAARKGLRASLDIDS